MFDVESSPFGYFAVKRSQRRPERIVAQHADRDSFAVAGPIDIFDEVVQIGGFDFVLALRRTLGAKPGRERKGSCKPQHDRDSGTHSRTKPLQGSGPANWVQECSVKTHKYNRR